MKQDNHGREDRPVMRLVELWVPDANDPEVAKELRRQSLLASQGEDEQEIMDFLEAAWVIESEAIHLAEMQDDEWKSLV